MSGQARRIHDVGLWVAVALAIGWAAYGLLLSPLPSEDATILLRYARHLAAGHGIVWNIGEPPVEGATSSASAGSTSPGAGRISDTFFL